MRTVELTSLSIILLLKMLLFLSFIQDGLLETVQSMTEASIATQIQTQYQTLRRDLQVILSSPYFKINAELVQSQLLLDEYDG